MVLIAVPDSEVSEPGFHQSARLHRCSLLSGAGCWLNSMNAHPGIVRKRRVRW